jgi:hypothetical protein
MEQFVHQQNIAIFRRLLSTQTDNDEARRERLLKLLADEEAKNHPRRNSMCRRDRQSRTCSSEPAIKDGEKPFGFGSASTWPAGAAR